MNDSLTSGGSTGGFRRRLFCTAGNLHQVFEYVGLVEVTEHVFLMNDTIGACYLAYLPFLGYVGFELNRSNYTS